MPFLGVSAIDGDEPRCCRRFADELSRRWPAASRRCRSCPSGARHATINVNGIDGGQPVDGIQTPCVADRCRAVFDRRFLIEESFEPCEGGNRRPRERARSKRRRASSTTLRDLMVVDPVRTPEDSPVIGALERAIRTRARRQADAVASPGTYDHKHVARIAGIPHCVAYGPGELELAHQPDESCRIDDLVNATKVLALAMLDLMGVGR